MDSSENPKLQHFMKLVDKYRRLGVRANADNPEDAKIARNFGAEGIGLFRTEHMFYGKNSEKPLFALRKMILSATPEERQKAVKELFHFVKKDIKGTLTAMEGLPVTFRCTNLFRAPGRRARSWRRRSASSSPTSPVARRDCMRPTR